MPRDTDDTDRIEIRTHPDKLRAVEVLRRAGWSNQEIANGLGLSLRTVERRCKVIDRIRDRPQARLAC